MTLHHTVLSRSHCTAPELLVYKYCWSTPVNQRLWYCTTVYALNALHWWCTVGWHVLHNWQCTVAQHVLYTGTVPLHDMHWTLALYHCMTCFVQWRCTVAWHAILYTGGMVLLLLSLFLLLMVVRTYFHSHFVRTFLLSHFFSLLCLVLCYLFVAFGWVITLSCLCASIECVRQSVLQNPVFGHLRARGSHSFEWIEPGRSTGIRSVWQLSGCLLKSCIHTSKLQDYITVPCLSESSYYGWSVLVQGWHKQIHSASRETTQQTI